MTGTHIIMLSEAFGRVAADGSAALAFRRQKIDRHLLVSERIVIDFTGVRSANSSFMNALLTGLFEDNGEVLLSKFVFKGCNPTVRVLVESAIHLGLCKHEERQRA